MARSVSRKKSRKKIYRSRYFYVSFLPLFSEVWETFSEKLTKSEIEKVVHFAASTGEYLAARVYDYNTDTLLITYKFVTKKQREEIEKEEKPVISKKPARKRKPVVKKKPRPKKKPVVRKKRVPKKKKERIRITRKKFSTLADVEHLSAMDKYRYIKRKIEENFLVRFVFKVKQASPKTAMLIRQKKMKRQKEYYVTTTWWNFRSIDDVNRFIAMRGFAYDQIVQIYYMPKR